MALRSSLAALWLLIICSYSLTLTTDAQSVPPESGSSICQLEYIEQPPDQILCNPYLNTELRLECTVTAQPQLGSGQTPRIIWNRSHYTVPQQIPSRQNQREKSQSQSKRNAGGQWITERLDAAQSDVIIREQVRTSSSTGLTSVRSRLELSNIDGSDSGEYWCTVELNGQGQVVPSDAFFLKEPAFYSQQSATACDTTGALSKNERKCAISMASTSTITAGPTSAMKPSPSPSTVTDSSRPASSSPPSSSSPNTPVESINAGRATTEETTSTVESIQMTDNSSSVSEEEEVGGNNSTDGDSNTNPNVLLELYIAVAILVIFGVIIIILVPITVCMCLKKRKNRRIEGMRRARQNLELASARCNNVQTSTTATLNIASDYLVPMPSWQSHKQKIQPVDCHSTDCLHRSYETTLSYSHEYEDVMDVIAMEEGNTHHEVYTSVSPTLSSVLEEATPPIATGVYVNDCPVKMKRNAAYRLYSTAEGKEMVRRHAYCNDVVVPLPLDCLHTQTEQSSNLE